MIEGIDVSSGTLDYEKVAAEISFVYQKLTDGVGSPCAQAKPHCDGLRKAGLSDLGGYAFLRIRHQMRQDSDEQCKQFLDAQAAAGCTLPAWLDIEFGEPGSSNRKATQSEVTAAVDLFLTTWDKCLGGGIAIYSSPGESLAMGVSLIEGIEKYPLAVAHYTSGKPSIPMPWHAYAFHQYAGDVLEYGGIVDKVRFAGSIEDLRVLR